MLASGTVLLLTSAAAMLVPTHPSPEYPVRYPVGGAALMLALAIVAIAVLRIRRVGIDAQASLRWSWPAAAMGATWGGVWLYATLSDLSVGILPWDLDEISLEHWRYYIAGVADLVAVPVMFLILVAMLRRVGPAVGWVLITLSMIQFLVVMVGEEGLWWSKALMAAFLYCPGLVVGVDVLCLRRDDSR